MEWVLCWFEAHPGTASWAQAIGTIVALGIAIAVPFQQNRMMRREASIRSHEQAIQLFDSLGAMVNFADNLLGLVDNELASEDALLETLSFAHEEHMFASMQVELDRYPIHHLPDYDSVTAALELKSTYTRACIALRGSIEALSVGDFQTYAVKTKRFSAEYAVYREIAKRFDAQANRYRERIGAA